MTAVARPPADGPRSVAVFGSCTTRDNFNSRFNPDYGQWFHVDLSANQTSVITMMSPPVDEEFTPTREMTDYDRWNVRSDLSREFLPLLADLKPDYLVLDFFADIHFGVLRLDDGRYLTNNRWKLWHTDLYRRLKDQGGFTPVRIWDDPDAYIALWAEALDRFATFVAEHCPDTRVVVHCGFNTEELVPSGDIRPIGMRDYRKTWRLDIPRANALWARLDDHAVSTYGWEAVDLRNEGYTSYADHPWGPFFVHYTMDYYHRFLGELHRIDLADSVDPATRARVQGVAAAVRQHALDEAAFARRLLAEHDALISALERPGVLRAARRALRRRADPTTSAEFSRRYPPDHYDRLVDELELDALEEALDAETMARVHAAVVAGREHAESYTPMWAQLVCDREQRIRQLEGLGLFGSVKFALGQRLRQTRSRWRQTRPTPHKESR